MKSIDEAMILCRTFVKFYNYRNLLVGTAVVYNRTRIITHAHDIRKIKPAKHASFSTKFLYCIIRGEKYRV